VSRLLGAQIKGEETVATQSVWQRKRNLKWPVNSHFLSLSNDQVIVRVDVILRSRRGHHLPYRRM
jgi:hypothetical protein